MRRCIIALLSVLLTAPPTTWAQQPSTIRINYVNADLTDVIRSLAASALQELLQRYAEESSVQLNRVDVASQPRAGQSGLLAIPVQLQCQGDIYGLVDFLSRLEHSEKLLALDELSLNAGFATGVRPVRRSGRVTAPQPQPQYFSWSLRLHALYRGAGGASGS